MSHVELTLAELEALILRSSLPVIAVEGKADKLALRRIESKLGVIGAVLSCGGQTTVLELYQRIGSRAGTAFLVDRDLSVYGAMPVRSPKVVWTWGYSLENDVIAGSRLDDLFESADVERFTRLVDLTCRWYAYELSNARRHGRDARIATGLAELIDLKAIALRPHVAEHSAIAAHECRLFRRTHRNFKRYLRGKHLLWIYEAILNRPGRPGRFNAGGIVEICLTQSANSKVSRIVRDLKRALAS